MLAEIYIGNRAIAEKLLRLPWMQYDGITEEEFLHLSTLHSIAMDNPTAITDQLPLDLDWALNPPDERHREAAAMLDDIWLTNRAIGDELAEWDWIADGITMEEFDQLSRLHFNVTDTPIFMGNVSEHIVQHWRSHGYLDDLLWYVSRIAPVSEMWAIRLLNTPWVTDGITQYESQVLRRTISKSPFNADLADRMFNLTWITDGVTKYEGDAAESLAEIYRSHSELGEIVFSLPWVTDGASQNESIIFWGMQVMGYMEEPLARAFLNGMVSVMALPGDLPSFAMESMGQIGEFPEKFAPIAETPWFADGLSRKDAAFITAIQYLALHSPELYESILKNHYTRSETVALSRPGDTTIWAFSNAPFPPGDNLFGIVAQAARITEDFMGTPFPTTDIILLVIRDDEGDDAITTAWYRDSHIQITRSGKNYTYDSLEVIWFATANYYYNYSFAPDWLRRGAADFIVAYIKDQIGVQTLASRRAMPLTTGESFLLEVYAALGKEVVSTAMRELYLLIPTRDSTLPSTEEEIYRVFLNNTPAELQDEFRNIYRHHHGKVYPE